MLNNGSTSTTAIEKYNKIPHKFYKIKKENDSSLSEKAIRILAMISYVVSNKRIVNYAYFYKTLARSQAQVKNYFNELKSAGICDVKFIRSGIIYGKKKRNFLQFNLTERGCSIMCISTSFAVVNSQNSFSKEIVGSIDNNKNIIDIKNIDIDIEALFVDNSPPPDPDHSISSDVLPLNLPKEESKSSIFFNKINLSKGKKPMKLTDILEITEEDAVVLRTMSKRDFSLNFMNELLEKLSKTKNDHVFFSKDAFLKYFAKVLAYEKRETVAVNNSNFKLKVNLSADHILDMKKKKEQESYLNSIEYSRSTTKDDQIKKKIAARFNVESAYLFLIKIREISEVGKCMRIDLLEGYLLSESEKNILLTEIKAVYGDHIEHVFIHAPNEHMVSLKKTQDPLFPPKKEEEKTISPTNNIVLETKEEEPQVKTIELLEGNTITDIIFNNMISEKYINYNYAKMMSKYVRFTHIEGEDELYLINTELDEFARTDLGYVKIFHANNKQILDRVIPTNISGSIYGGVKIYDYSQHKILN